MAKDLSRSQERSGTRRLFLSGAAVTLVAGLALFAWVWLPSFQQSPNMSGVNGPRTDQAQGQSAARLTTPPPNAQFNASNNETIGRAHEITSTAQSEQTLSPQQIAAVKDFAAGQQPAENVGFTIAIGAAVPRQVDLQDIPGQLRDALPSYENAQYILVRHQFIIVEKQTRRILAIIPS